MSLGIAIKGPEGIVLAADSRVTLFNQIQAAPPPAPPMLIPATFDSATKLLNIRSNRKTDGKESYVAAVTYGTGAIIGSNQPRTAHSFLPELDNEIGEERLSVRKFAEVLGDFFMRQWKAAQMHIPLLPGEQDMVFLVGGYDETEPYGKVFEVFVPTNPAPVERIPMGEFGIIWGGQRNIADRIFQGFDGAAAGAIFDFFHVPAQQRGSSLENHLKQQLMLKIPIAFLPLQDCVDLATFIVRATSLLQEWTIDVRGVGGAIDVATITRTQGFRPIRVKTISGERFV
jgi:hypothetical protein